MKPHRLLQAYLGLNRNARILGTAALLLLGGLAVFIAWRQFGDVFNKRERTFRKTVNNTFFTNLIASGATTREVLSEVEDLQPYASGFIGLSRRKLTLPEASDLASRTGAEILDIAVTAQKSRKELTGWLTETYPSQQGFTTWVRENLAIKVIDCPDVLAVTTTPPREGVGFPLEQVARHVFLRWPRSDVWVNKGWSWTIPPQFDDATPFSRWGLARVRIGKAWGVIDEAGKIIQPPSFDAIEAFEEQGSARVSKDGKWGLLDRAGKLVAQPEWEDVQHFINGFIPVKREGKWGYLDADRQTGDPVRVGGRVALFARRLRGRDARRKTRFHRCSRQGNRRAGVGWRAELCQGRSRHGPPRGSLGLDRRERHSAHRADLCGPLEDAAVRSGFPPGLAT